MPNWKKVIVSGSDATLNSLNVVSGSTISGSIRTTGSLTVIGSESITGSFAVSGAAGTTVFSANADTLIFSGSLYTSGSISATGSLSVNGGITGSLLGTASYAITASYAMNGGSGGGTSALYILDEGITQGSASFLDFVGAGVTATVTNGTASINIPGGGGSSQAGGNSVLSQSAASVTWSFTHNLNTQYPVFTIFDSNNDVIIPQRINAVNTSSALIYFSTPRSGYAVASQGGNVTSASYALVAISASYASASTSASYSLIATSASYANNATTASYANNATTASYANNTTTASYSLIATSASYASASTSASYATNALTASYALVAAAGGFPYTGSAQITGSLGVTGSLTVSGSITSTGTITAQTLVVQTITSSVIYSSGSNKFGNDLANTQQLTGSVLVTGSLAVNGSNVILTNQTASMSVATASFALNGGVTQILAGANVTIAPTNGKGQVTISATGGGGSNFNTATGSYGSFYDTTTQTNPVANIPRSMSFNTTDITNGVSISGSTSPFNTYIKTENPGVYDIQFSAQIDKTDSGADEIVIWLAKNGTALTDTATTLTLTGNNDKQVAAWNWFVNSAANDYYQIIWYSADTDLRILAETAGGGHPGIPSVIATVNRVDQFLSNTGSFSGSFNGQFTGSLLGTATTASFVQTAQTASFVTLAQTASFVTTAQTASFVTTAQTASFVTLAQTASFVQNAISASYSNNSTSASYATNALTASYVANASSFPFTGSAIITGSLVVTGSSTATLGYTGSLLGIATTASYALQAVSASYATFATTASSAPGYTVSFTQSVAAATWSFIHNMNTRYPIVQVYGSDYKQIIPNDIVGVDVNTAEIRFDYATTGYVIMSNGGGLYVTGSTSLLNQTSAATTWSFTHNLNSKYVNFEVYDSNDYVIIPAGIRAIDVNTAELHFAGATSGKAVANFSGINGAPNATTASYALTATSASYAATASYLNPIVSSYVVLTQVSQSLNFIDDAAAAAGGVPLGGLYRNGNFILIRIS